jgi:deoxyribonuclease V
MAPYPHPENGDTMQQVIVHEWQLDQAQALALQAAFAPQVERQDRLGPMRHVAGVDVAYDKHSDCMVAAAVVLDATTLAVVETQIANDVVQFEYIPGLFSFRELPAIARALAMLDTTPDLIVCDGQGIAHPRRFGLACHLGVLFDVPTIGCGKTLLTGHFDALPKQRGAIAPLLDGDETIGAAVYTQDDTKPVYVSNGHRISLATACNWILRLSPHYRQPETTRAADHAVKLALAARKADAEAASAAVPFAFTQGSP